MKIHCAILVTTLLTSIWTSVFSCLHLTGLVQVNTEGFKRDTLVAGRISFLFLKSTFVTCLSNFLCRRERNYDLQVTVFLINYRVTYLESMSAREKQCRLVFRIFPRAGLCFMKHPFNCYPPDSDNQFVINQASLQGLQVGTVHNESHSRVVRTLASCS
jgi:hypothetical protein